LRSRPARVDRRVLVWEAVVRACHWALATLVIVDLVRDDGDWLHRVLGYLAVAVVLVRLCRACFARGPGSLSALKPSVSRTAAYLRRAAPRTLGHDPLGVWMIWFVWCLVLLLGITGWMSRLDAFWGDERVQAVHRWLADAMLAAVVVHLAGVAAMSWHWRENLVAAMVSGRKREADGD
jgi:cytochrome b